MKGWGGDGTGHEALRFGGMCTHVFRVDGLLGVLILSCKDIILAANREGLVFLLALDSA